ncbi:hypothetical protein SUGI_0471510 [Cryptomeria japonica]|nr:hypothetical protein SUGI_0471510 [Cryptomeria japonica]
MEQREEAQVGWETIKDYIREKEVETRTGRVAKQKDVGMKTKFALEDYWVNGSGDHVSPPAVIIKNLVAFEGTANFHAISPTRTLGFRGSESNQRVKTP